MRTSNFGAVIAACSQRNGNSKVKDTLTFQRTGHCAVQEHTLVYVKYEYILNLPTPATTTKAQKVFLA